MKKTAITLIIFGQEAGWLFMFFNFLNERAASGLSVIVLWLVFPLSFAFNYWTQNVPISKYFKRLASVFLALCLILIITKVLLYPDYSLFSRDVLLAIPRAVGNIFNSFSSELMTVITTLSLWLAGWRLSSRQASFATVLTEFQLGIIAIIIIVLLDSLFGFGTGYTFLILLFFALSFAGMGFARQFQSVSRSERDSFWLGLIITSVIVIVGAGFFVSGLIDRDVINAILVPLKWIWHGLSWLFNYLVSLLPPVRPEDLGLTPTPEPTATPENNDITLGFSPAVRNALKIGYNIIMFGLIAAAIWRVTSAILNTIKNRDRNVDVEIESIKGGFWSDLAALIKKFISLLIPWIKFKPRGADTAGNPDVRNLYRRLLYSLKSKGYPRNVNETPFEYMATISHFFPINQNELQTLTMNYASSRYGKAIFSREELAKLVSDWKLLKKVKINKKQDESSDEK